MGRTSGVSRDQSLPFQFLRTNRQAWRALVLLFLVSLPAVTTRIYASDEVEYFSYLRSLWFDRDVSFENEYRYFYEHGLSSASGFHETFLERQTVTGLRENWGTIGCAILWSPFYGAGDLAAHALRMAGRPVETDGFSHPYVAAVSYGSAFYGFMALVLSAMAARKVLGKAAPTGRAEAGVVLAAWLGTPLLFYMYVSPPFSHACSAFAVAAFVLTWLHVRETWSTGGLVRLGILAALMTMVREQDAFFAIGAGLDLLWTLVRGPAAGQADRGRRPALSLLGGALAGVAAFAAAFLPQALAYLALNGRIGPSQVVARKMYWHAPHALQVLFSPEHGWFFWTPLALLAVFGVAAIAREAGDRRRVAVALLAMVALQVYVSGSVDSWSAAGAFGHRRFVGTTVVLVVGLASLAHAAGRRQVRLGLGAALVLCTWWNLALVAQFGTGLMDRQRLELGRNARMAFIEVPSRLPGLAWRYLFDRASFYAPPNGGPR
jgi:hypothetical protein